LSEPAKVRPEARVLTYKIGGTATLPPPKNEPRTQPKQPPVTATEAVVAQGRDLYNGHCGMCHGPNALAGSVIPDLRYMTPEKHEMFAGIVAGAYRAKGMPGFSDTLKPEDVEAIHQYVIKRANDLQTQLGSTS